MKSVTMVHEAIIQGERTGQRLPALECIYINNSVLESALLILRTSLSVASDALRDLRERGREDGREKRGEGSDSMLCQALLVVTGVDFFTAPSTSLCARAWPQPRVEETCTPPPSQRVRLPTPGRGSRGCAGAQAGVRWAGQS